jgi:myosin heavy subunit
LGNLVFASDPYNTESSIITSTTKLRKLAELMGIPIKSLTHALTSRTIAARREVVQTQVTADRAKDACDALAKEIYHGTFLWLVRHINAATIPSIPLKRGLLLNEQRVVVVVLLLLW